MSFQAMTWAVAQRTPNAGQKLVLLMLANHCNGHTGQCNPSHKLLADECSMGASTLKAHLASLEELGFITILHRAEDGVSLPNQYVLNLGGVGQNLTGGGSESGRGVGQNLATNQEDKPGIEPTAPAWVFDLFPDVSREVVTQFHQVRKTLRAPITGLAVKGIRREAAKAGISIEAALLMCVERSWRGFNAEWVKDKGQSAQTFDWTNELKGAV